jgi:hypothetical protein
MLDTLLCLKFGSITIHWAAFYSRLYVTNMVTYGEGTECLKRVYGRWNVESCKLYRETQSGERWNMKRSNTKDRGLESENGNWGGGACNKNGIAQNSTSRLSVGRKNKEQEYSATVDPMAKPVPESSRRTLVTSIHNLERMECINTKFVKLMWKRPQT